VFDEIVDRRAALGVIGASGFALIGEQAAGGQIVGPIQSFSKAAQELLAKILDAPDFGGRIPKAEAEQLERLEGKPNNQIMLALLPVAQLYSLPPISNYRVGVVARGASGSLYLGANLELAGQPLGSAVHGEQAACSIAYMYGEAGLDAIAVTAAPCGHCRQFLEELSPSGDLPVLIRGKEPIALKSLLPSAFSPRDLGVTTGALPPSRVAIVLNGSHAAEDDTSLKKALEAACHSYAPYSKARSGVAVMTADGNVYSGSYIENVAFNPSLPPLQVALISMLRARKSFAEIREVTLVELDNAVISHKAVIEATLSSIAPNARLRRAGGRLEG
jgi:cytidine deaminase